MGTAAGVGMLLHEDRIPLLEEPEALCRHYNLDPLGTIASGALLLTVAPSSTSQIIDRLTDAGIAVSVIGTVQPPAFGFKMERQGTLVDLPMFNRDEIGKVFEETD